ncbi:MAG: cytidylate kinase family protein [Alphaproteobacteria bacterium]|nr:cytidylate kinase family protein [Alphaproteobacteria bacterium]
MAHIITLSGMLGSGKSTAAKLLAAKLGYGYYSTGAAQRALAQQRGVTTLELNKMAETDSTIDRQIDGVFQALAGGDANLVVDSRLAFFFLPDSFKVKLNVDPETAGARVFNDSARKGERKYASGAEATEALLSRRALERGRWKKIYGVDIDDDGLFDCVIDTTGRTPEQVRDLILEKLELS